MVKFGKQLERELVPEWREAYCTYKHLKRDVKRIKQQRSTGPTFTRTGSIGLLRSLVSFKHNPQTFSGPLRPDKISFSPRGQPRDVIVVHKDGDVYETELLEPLVHAPQDKTFFRRLDVQLNKVNRFYKKKEAEYVTQAGRLERQMLVLIDMQETLARQGLDSPGFPNHLYGSKLSQHAEKHVSDETPLMDENLKSDEFPMQTSLMRPSLIHEDTTYPGEEQEEEGELEGIIQSFIASVATTTPRERISPGSRDNPDLEAFSVLSETKPSFRRASSNRVQFTANGIDNSDQRSPRSAMKKRFLTLEPTGTRNVLGQRENVGDPSSEAKEIEVVVMNPDVKEEKQVLVFTQKKLNHAMKLLRMAFIEFYRGLGLLKSYSSLNMLAFAKIMKKYDKVTRWNLSRLYVKEVESSYFATSGKIQKLITKVEDIFTNHFANGIRKKALAQLRPSQQLASHSITFFLGIFSGCSFALLLTFISLVTNPMAFQSAGGSNIGGQHYLDSVFPVVSTLALILFHIYLYGWNVYTWQRTRVNYPFIFEFSPGTELRYREVLLVSTGFTTLLLGGMCIHVFASTHEFPRNYASEFIPLVIVLLFVVALFLPFNFIYRSSRAFFLRCCQHIFFAPLYKVVLSDFFLGDQFTSQVLVFRNLEFIMCYYTGGFFKSRNSDACTTNTAYRDLAYVVALLPYWWRFLQCMRRWVDERHKMQLANAGKYMVAMVAVALRLAYKYYSYNVVWLVFFILASIVATLYSLYWDLVVDWGLLNRNSRNRWLRDELILKRKYLYFISMGVNTVLRLAWLFSLLRIAVPAHQDAFDVVVASLEVFRRGAWNFFRIENEHLNNVGKYRAVKTVPLPFKEFD